MKRLQVCRCSGTQLRTNAPSWAHPEHTVCTLHFCVDLPFCGRVADVARARAEAGPGEQKCSPGDSHHVHLGAGSWFATGRELQANKVGAWLPARGAS